MNAILGLVGKVVGVNGILSGARVYLVGAAMILVGGADVLTSAAAVTDLGTLWVFIQGFAHSAGVMKVLEGLLAIGLRHAVAKTEVAGLADSALATVPAGPDTAVRG